MLLWISGVQFLVIAILIVRNSHLAKIIKNFDMLANEDPMPVGLQIGEVSISEQLANVAVADSYYVVAFVSDTCPSCKDLVEEMAASRVDLPVFVSLYEGGRDGDLSRRERVVNLLDGMGAEIWRGSDCKRSYSVWGHPSSLPVVVLMKGNHVVRSSYKWQVIAHVMQNA